MYCFLYLTLTLLKALFSAHTGTRDLRPLIFDLSRETNVRFGTVAAFNRTCYLQFCLTARGLHNAFVWCLSPHL